MAQGLSRNGARWPGRYPVRVDRVCHAGGQWRFTVCEKERWGLIESGRFPGDGNWLLKLFGLA